MRLGTKEFLPPDPEESAVCASVGRLLLEGQMDSTAERRPAPVISVTGSKGGVGATCVATQLAGALQSHAPTAIVDLDVLSGDVALYLDITPHHTLSDLKRETEELDATYLRMLLHGHSSGLQVLASPDRLEEAEALHVTQLERALEILTAEFRWVLLDVPRAWGEWSLRAFDLSDQILLVTSLQVPALRHARRQLELFSRLGYGHKVRLLANRRGPGDAVTEADFKTFLKRSPDVCLPNDFEAMTTSIDQGKPLAEISARRGLPAAYRSLGVQAHEWCGVPLRPDHRGSGRLRRVLHRLRPKRNVSA